jgi:hypothetical protein
MKWSLFVDEADSGNNKMVEWVACVDVELTKLRKGSYSSFSFLLATKATLFDRAWPRDKAGESDGTIDNVGWLDDKSRADVDDEKAKSNEGEMLAQKKFKDIEIYLTSSPLKEVH